MISLLLYALLSRNDCEKVYLLYGHPVMLGVRISPYLYGNSDLGIRNTDRTLMRTQNVTGISGI
jgi:hypothetical protein